MPKDKLVIEIIREGEEKDSLLSLDREILKEYARLTYIEALLSWTCQGCHSFSVRAEYVFRSNSVLVETLFEEMSPSWDVLYDFCSELNDLISERKVLTDEEWFRCSQIKPSPFILDKDGGWITDEEGNPYVLTVEEVIFRLNKNCISCAPLI